jgi:hypothetical protein
MGEWSKGTWKKNKKRGRQLKEAEGLGKKRIEKRKCKSLGKNWVRLIRVN